MNVKILKRAVSRETYYKLLNALCMFVFYPAVFRKVLSANLERRISMGRIEPVRFAILVATLFLIVSIKIVKETNLRCGVRSISKS